jgi:GDP-4-dehydro-6-deoxy-D-mannose reductase
MRRVLVIGVTGFAGSHLVDYMLTRSDCEIFGIQRWRSRTENISTLPARSRFLVRPARWSSTRRHARKGASDGFHLAAQSFVPTSWSAPTESLACSGK